MSKNSRFKEAVDSIKLAAGIEDAEERQDKVNRAIKDVERVESDYAHDLIHVTKESIGRKDDKNGLKQTIEEKDDEITELNKKLDKAKDDNSLTDLTEENEKLKGFKEKILARNRTDFVTNYGIIKDHKNYDKVKDKLVLPDSDNGEMDFSKLSDDEIEKNQVVIQDARSYDIFGNIKSDKTFHGETVLKSGKDEGYFQDEDFN